MRQPLSCIIGCRNLPVFNVIKGQKKLMGVKSRIINQFGILIAVIFVMVLILIVHIVKGVTALRRIFARVRLRLRCLCYSLILKIGKFQTIRSGRMAIKESITQLKPDWRLIFYGRYAPNMKMRCQDKPNRNIKIGFNYAS